MRTINSLFCLPAALLLLTGCNNSQQKTNDAQPQDILSQADDQLVEQVQIAMLQELLSINGGEDEEMLRKCCTKNALKQLHDDYEYDDINENSIAIWAINGRSGTDLLMVLSSLKKVAPDTYQVEFNEFFDDELQGTSVMQYKLAIENGEWKIDSYYQISQN